MVTHFYKNISLDRAALKKKKNNLFCLFERLGDIDYLLSASSFTRCPQKLGSQELRTQPRSPLWVPETQLFELLPLPRQVYLAGSWNQKLRAGT